MIRILREGEANFERDLHALRDVLRGGGLVAGGAGLDIPAIVREILADIAARGDDALVDWERKLDKAELTPQTIRVPAEAIRRAHAAAEPEFLALVRRAAENIREYQQHIRVQAPPALRRGGRSLGLRYTPMDRVGVYVPGGRAMYPSTVLMTVVPAQVAGVGQIALASPPQPVGEVDSMVLALAGELGVTEVYRLGGAVAVGAMGLGTPGISAVHKIVGPGNAFVAEAKKQLFGRVSIDSIAGPSEVLILADQTAAPAWVAADMLAQAEHDPGSAVLVTCSERLAAAVAAELGKQVPRLSRAAAIGPALEKYSGIVVVSSIDRACEVANEFATEHLQIIVADEERALSLVRHGGAIFLGAHTPVPLGDYYAGPSHVLPTGGTARFFGPLSVNDFLKASSLVRYGPGDLAADAADVADFATREGLTAHAQAVRVRTEKKT